MPGITKRLGNVIPLIGKGSNKGDESMAGKGPNILALGPFAIDTNRASAWNREIPAYQNSHHHGSSQRQRAGGGVDHGGQNDDSRIEIHKSHREQRQT